MRISRTNIEQRGDRPSPAEMIAAADLDLVQLDCLDGLPAEAANAFFQALPSFHRYFFMDDQLRLITNAGSGNVTRCVEELGSYLREHRDPHLPISAIRGDNILPQLAELSAAGIPFEDEATGEPLLEISHPLLAVQVELGAGPLATALAEGSRMVVAGSYDPTAPFLAAGVSLLEIAWDDHDRLSQWAVASELSSQANCVVEMNPVEQLELQPLATVPFEAEKQIERLRTSATESLRCADVVCDTSSLNLVPLEYGRFLIAGVAGSGPSDDWRVKFVYSSDGEAVKVRWSCIPRDAVAISVDTRPAKEWL